MSKYKIKRGPKIFRVTCVFIWMYLHSPARSIVPIPTITHLLTHSLYICFFLICLKILFLEDFQTSSFCNVRAF